MTISGWLLPPINAQYTPEPRKPRKPPKRGPLAVRSSRRKYDIPAMLRDRLNGDLWCDIEVRYGLTPLPNRSPGTYASQVCMRSSECKKLSPQDIVKLEQAPRKPYTKH
jgi:hypothetical protein